MNTLIKVASNKKKWKYLTRGLTGAGAGALAGEAVNRFSGNKDPEKRKRNVGKGALVGAGSAMLLGAKGTKKVGKGVLKANKKVTPGFNTAKPWFTG